jgi:hypothetical protein
MGSEAAESEECVVQSILPFDGRFVCHGNCGRRDVVTDSIDRGLRLACQHTDETKAA